MFSEPYTEGRRTTAPDGPRKRPALERLAGEKRLEKNADFRACGVSTYIPSNVRINLLLTRARQSIYLQHKIYNAILVRVLTDLNERAHRGDALGRTSGRASRWMTSVAGGPRETFVTAGRWTARASSGRVATPLPPPPLANTNATTAAKSTVRRAHTYRWGITTIAAYV